MAYTPKYTSRLIYIMYRSISCFGYFAALISIVLLNSWSTKALTRQSTLNDLNITEERTCKRNQAAVVILNMISFVYALTTIPFVIYSFIHGVTFLTFANNPQLFNTLNNYFIFVQFPTYLCSGFNAMVYIFKDKKIKKYYLCWLQCRT